MGDQQWVYEFSEGSRDMRELLGGKGANVAEMTRVLGAGPGARGLHDHHRGVRRVHAGTARRSPTGWPSRSRRRSSKLQEQAGKTLGDDEDPLLVSVRSGARESMPGMLDTVLNLGLNDTSVEGLARATENERFAWDSYRRFVQMFGNVSHGIPGEQFEDAIKEVKEDRGVKDDVDLDVDALKELTRALQGPLRVPAGPAGAAAPGDPRGVRLLDGRAREVLPAAEPHPRRLGHGGQRPADGVRQQGRHVGLRRGVQPRRGDRRARAERRLPGQRPGRGRRLRRAQHARHRRPRRTSSRRRTRS